MDLLTLARTIDAPTARAFVSAARHLFDALLIEAERVKPARTPAARDYDGPALARTTPAGGWLTHDELRDTARRLAEAVAAERWTDGLLAALTFIAGLGGLR